MVAGAPRATIIGSGEHFAQTVSQRELWEGFFAHHFGERRSARMAFAASSIVQRHAALNPLIESVADWSTGTRMERYPTEAMALGAPALRDAFTSARTSPQSIGLFVVASCTGYATPGVDLRLADELGMSSSVRRVIIGHTGCHAALPALAVVEDFVRIHGRPAALLCVEVSSLHLQPATTDLEQVIVHSLFSDAAAAVIVAPGTSAGGLEIIDLMTLSDPTSMDHMTWNVTDHGFRMTLSRHVPDVVASMIKPFVEELLERNGLRSEEVAGWAVHPGGPRILETVGDQLSLDGSDLTASRETLELHGNCSSPTILLVLNRLRRGLGRNTGQIVLGLSFGPGMTLCAGLFRTT